MFIFFILSVLYGIRTERSLTIIYTNNIYGSLEASRAYWVSLELPPDIGNAASLEVLLERERKKGSVVLLNSGNLAPFNLPGEYKSSDELASFLNNLGYDATLIGTNELSFGMDFLSKLKNESDVNFISSNIEEGDEEFMILMRDDFKVGIFGITSPYAILFVPSKYRDELKIESNIEEVSRIVVEKLKKNKVDIIIGLSDAGFTKDSIIGETVDGIDLIIGASDRGRAMNEPFETPVNHTLLCKTYSDLSSAGKLILYFDKNNNIAGYENNLISLFTEEYPPYK